MKKILLLLALCAGTVTAMAQNITIAPFNNITIAPFNNTARGNLNQPLKIDSSWRKLSNTPLKSNFFKQEPIDFKNLTADKPQNTLFIAEETYKMPIAKLDGYAKMPVVVLDGNSKMPVVGKAQKAGNNTVQVVPN
ncbi:MAG: hypothetical protein V4456_14505 [Bacteroidota bacterium]